MVCALILGRSAWFSGKKVRCDPRASLSSFRRFCTKNRIETELSPSARELAETSRFEAVRDNLAAAYRLGDRVRGRLIHHPRALGGYKWLFQNVSDVQVDQLPDDVTTHLDADQPAPPCPSPFDFGRVDLCLVDPDSTELYAVQLGPATDTWYLVSSDYYRQRVPPDHGDP